MPREKDKEFSSSTVIREDFLQKVSLDMALDSGGNSREWHFRQRDNKRGLI